MNPYFDPLFAGKRAPKKYRPAVDNPEWYAQFSSANETNRDRLVEQWVHALIEKTETDRRFAAGPFFMTHQEWVCALYPYVKPEHCAVTDATEGVALIRSLFGVAEQPGLYQRLLQSAWSNDTHLQVAAMLAFRDNPQKVMGSYWIAAPLVRNRLLAAYERMERPAQLREAACLLATLHSEDQTLPTTDPVVVAWGYFAQQFDSHGRNERVMHRAIAGLQSCIDTAGPALLLHFVASRAGYTFSIAALANGKEQPSAFDLLRACYAEHAAHWTKMEELGVSAEDAIRLRPPAAARLADVTPAV